MSLVLNSLSLARNGEIHLDDVSLDFDRGCLTTVLGRTLSGKTTLMRAIAGLQEIDSGTLMRDGHSFGDLPAWRRDVAMVYQQFINYPHLSVFENVAFPLRKRKVAEDEVSLRVRTVLDTVGLGAFLERKPSQLSGGQQQRVALARALVRNADVLLLDEPLVNLDYKLREQLREEFRGLLTSQADATVIYSTTEPAEAMMLGDRLIVMHEGRVLQVGAPMAVFQRPASALVARIVTDPPMTIVTGNLVDGRIFFEGGLVLTAPTGLATLEQGRYRFGIRANEIELVDNGGIAGRVTFGEVSGSETFLHVDTVLGEAVVQLEGVHRIETGSLLGLSLAPDRLFVFAPEGEGALLRAPGIGED
ncbi:ABC transporter ATP-binding protein [Rhizobium rosettiformans]|jgi:glycerol transport system ATP-binding protein|uniref:ABC transporter ATP-binding protein n=1 Tax=Rhizobium rosettiformans TaxID=1368430 RepID=UPI002866A4A9|nr:ABC transporter ATP-binding protein [Rhizobium rosettiformans]MDR7031188.1 glycerol transport system ATP-binding protein [Rhizobium rosettiformans]MDR7066753.1 glycerol transport system ATP-binding protein [Rhizobium rosettiformans]